MSMGQSFNAAIDGINKVKAEDRREQQFALKQKVAERKQELEMQNLESDATIKGRQAKAIERLEKDAQQAKKARGNITKQLMNQYTLGEADDKDIKGYLKQNPDMVKSLGIANPATFTTPTYEQSRKLLSEIVPAAEGQSEESYDAMLKEVYNLPQLNTQLFTVDGREPMLMSQLHAGMGIDSALLSKQQRKTEQVFAKLRTSLDDVSKKHKPSSYMQAFEAWDAETDPVKKQVLEDQLSKLSTTKGADLDELFKIQDKLMQEKNSPRPYTQADSGKYEDSEQKVIDDKLKSVEARIKKLTTYAPTQEKTSATRTREQSEEATEKLMTSSTDYLSKDGYTYNGKTYKYNSSDAINEADIDIESKTVNSKDYTTELKKEADAVTKQAKQLRAYKDVQELINHKSFKSGYLDRIATWISSVTPEYVFNADAKQIATDAGISIEAANRLKQMSGASATDSEYFRTVLMTTGDTSQSEQARRATIDNTVRSEQAKVDTSIHDIAQKGLPKTAKEVYTISNPASQSEKKQSPRREREETKTGWKKAWRNR